MDTIVIRSASLVDFELLVDFIRQYYEFDGLVFEPAAIRSGLKVLLADQTIGQAWLVEDAGKPIGYAIATFGFDLEFGGRLATLTDIYLEASHRKSGLGRRLLGAVEEYCRHCGVRALELQVERHNTAAQSFYLRQGFEALDRLPLTKRL